MRGSLEATGDLFQPYRLVDDEGGVVAPAAAYFAELSGVRAAGDDAAFLWDGSAAVVPVPVGARGGLGSGDCGWKPATSAAGCRSGSNRSGRTGGPTAMGAVVRASAGRVNAVTGKPVAG